MSNQKNDFMEEVMKKVEKQKENLIEAQGFVPEDKKYFLETYKFIKENNYPEKIFLTNLKTLKLIKYTEYKSSNIGANYSIKKNEIEYYDEIDLNHESFHVASKFGIISKNDEYIGLNEGITELFASQSSKDKIINYPFEKMIAEIIQKAYGKEIFISYFNSNSKEFLDQFDKKKISILLENLDEYTKTMEYYLRVLSNMKNNEIYDIKSKLMLDFDSTMDSIVDLIDTKGLNPEEQKQLDEEITLIIKTNMNTNEMKCIMSLIGNKNEYNQYISLFNKPNSHNKRRP